MGSGAFGLVWPTAITPLEKTLNNEYILLNYCTRSSEWCWLVPLKTYHIICYEAATVRSSYCAQWPLLTLTTTIGWCAPMRLLWYFNRMLVNDRFRILIILGRHWSMCYWLCGLWHICWRASNREMIRPQVFKLGRIELPSYFNGIPFEVMIQFECGRIRA